MSSDQPYTPRFYVWPHDPTGIIREALREYVGDGDGEDENVLAAHDARVKRDAVQQFIEACRGKLDEPGFLLPFNHWEDIEAAIRVAESYVKNYPEETP